MCARDCDVFRRRVLMGHGVCNCRSCVLTGLWPVCWLTLGWGHALLMILSSSSPPPSSSLLSFCLPSVFLPSSFFPFLSLSHSLSLTWKSCDIPVTLLTFYGWITVLTVEDCNFLAVLKSHTSSPPAVHTNFHMMSYYSHFPHTRLCPFRPGWRNRTSDFRAAWWTSSLELS